MSELRENHSKLMIQVLNQQNTMKNMEDAMSPARQLDHRQIEAMMDKKLQQHYDSLPFAQVMETQTSAF